MTLKQKIVELLEKRIEGEVESLAQQIIDSIPIVYLNNNGPVDASIENLYHPRLQVNKIGEICLTTARRHTLTSGICVGVVNGSEYKYGLGKKWDDWEVFGELHDYDEGVIVRIQNTEKFWEKF